MHTSQNQAISENIENVNTIGYIRKDTNFSKLLPDINDNNKINTSNDRHLERLHYSDRWGDDDEKSKVDLTEEMSSLSVNQINHDFNVRAMRRMYDGIRAAIKGHSR
jgi:flagellar basal body rod protein FlgB